MGKHNSPAIGRAENEDGGKVRRGKVTESASSSMSNSESLPSRGGDYLKISENLSSSIVISFLVRALNSFFLALSEILPLF